MQIVIGNIIALIASILMVYSGYIKQKKKILYTQTIQLCFSSLSNIILGGITGGIIDLLGCVRNILCYKGKLNKVSKIILIILSTSLTLIFNNMGVLGLLPLISTITYILLMTINDVIKFKYLLIFTAFLWLVYSMCIQSYVGAAFNVMNIAANVSSIIQIKKHNKSEVKTEKKIK